MYLLFVSSFSELAMFSPGSKRLHTAKLNLAHFFVLVMRLPTVLPTCAVLSLVIASLTMLYFKYNMRQM